MTAAPCVPRVQRWNCAELACEDALVRIAPRHLTRSQRRDASAAPIKLGIRRRSREIHDDVNVRAIPLFNGPHTIEDARTLQISGDAPKFLIRRTPILAYIAKAPRTREGLRECATEYLIACIGHLLPVKIAIAGLCRYRYTRGKKPDVRFLSRMFRDADEQLVHGVELVARCFDMVAERVSVEVRNDERGFYTVEFISDVIKHVYKDQYDAIATALGKMIGFDALVGANDRHAMNWGVIENVVRSGAAPRFSPLFDTARGLFWNRSDERLKELTRTSGDRKQLIRTYGEGSSPLIGTSSAKGEPAGNHFAVVEHVVNYWKGPILFGVSSIVKAFSADSTAVMLHRRFGRMLSRLRLELIDELLRYRHRRLMDLLQGESE